MAGKVVTTAAPTKQEAAAVRNYVGKTAKANPGTSRAVEKVGSDARNVNYYRGAADPESKKKKGEAREAAQRDRNLAARMEGNGQQTQYQQEAQQPQQEQAPETTFTDEANKAQSQTEQQEATRYTQEANDPAKTLAETAEKGQAPKLTGDKLQDVVNGNKYARQVADEANAEATRLQSEKDQNSNMWVDGVFIGMDEETAKQYDDRIKAAKDRAADALAGIQNITTDERDAALKAYQDAVEAEHTATASETAVSQADADAARQNRKAAEEALKDINRSLGNEVYYGLADEAQARDLFEGWAGERAAGTASALGTALEWFDTASDDMTRYEYDQEHGEGAYDRAIEGKNVNAIGDAGRELFEAAQGWNEQAKKDWASGTEDMSETGKQIAGIGKSAADMTMDMVDNFILPGSGRVAMAGRAAGQGSLTQAERGNNDIDTRMAKAAFDGATAFLSEYLMGGAEAVYGKSTIGKAINSAISNLPQGTQTVTKMFMNTEGAEEGLEYALGYLGDRILGFDQEASFDWGELQQNVAVGYIMGVLFNGVTSGISYDSKKLKAVVDESIEAARSGMSPEEITRAAITQPDDNVKIAAGKQRANANVEAEAETAAPETEAGTAPAEGQPAAQPEGETAADTTPGEGEPTMSEGGNPEAEGEITPETEGTPEGNPEATQTDEAATLAETAENGAPTEAPENEANTLTETAEGHGGVNAPGTTENAAEANSEAPGGSVEGNPLVTAAEGNQNAGDQTAGQTGTEGTAEGSTEGTAEGTTEGPAAEGTQPNGQGARSAEGTGPERTSQFYENTLTKDEGTKVREPLTYLGKSDYDTLRGAMDRLNLNGEAETSALMTSEMWNDEQVATARIVRQSLFDDANRTGDWTAYDSWRKICDEHHRVIARALRQVGINNNVSAESVASMAHALLDGIEQDINERGTSQTAGRVKPEEVAQVRQQVDESIRTMSALEAEEAELRNSGLSEEEACAQMKDKYLDACQKVVAERNMGLLWDDLLGRNKAIREGKADVDTKLKSMLAKEDPEYIRNYLRANVSGQAADVVYKGRPTVKQAANFVSSLQKLCQLFGSGTSLRNVEGNTVFGAIDWASNQTGGVIVDSFLSLFTGNRTRGFESGLFNKANRQAVTKASRRSILEIAANMDMREDGKYLSGNTAFSPYNAGTRWLARLNQALSYALNTSDAAAVGLNESSASSAALMAGQRSGMTEETAQRIGQQEAEFRTFKDKNAVTEMLTGAQQFADLLGFGGEVEWKKGGVLPVPKGRKGGFGLGTAIQPYIGVPANIALKGVQYSPVGAVKGAIDAGRAVSQSRNAAKGSQAAQDAMVLQNKAAGEIGRGITGTALIVLLKAAFKKAKDEDKEFFHDWDLETDPDIKAQNRAEGKFGQQINLDQFLRNIRGEEGETIQQGDRMVDISGIEPLNQFLTMASLMADDDNASTPEAYTNALLTGAEETLTDLPCLEAIGSFVDTYNNAKIYDTNVTVDAEGNETEERVENKTMTGLNAAGAMAGSVASGFIPAPVRHLAQVTDEKQRDTTAETSSGRAVNQLKMAIPGLRETLPAKTDAYGNEVTQGDAATRAANTYLGNKYSQVNQSDVSREVERIRESTGVDLTPDRYGPKTFTYGSGKNKETVRVTNEESTDLKNQRGQEFESAMQTLMDDPVYQQADDDTKQALANAARLYGNDTLRTEVAEKNGIEFESKYADIRELDDPVEVLAAQTSYNTAVRNEDWDAVDTLLRTIQRGDGRISEGGMDYMIGKDSKINYYTYLADHGVPTKRAKAFDAEVKELYTSEKREAARSSDMIRIAGNGKYSDKEADAIMSYERAISKETIERYQGQVQYQLDQAGLGGRYGEVWNLLESVRDGDMEKDDFRAWIRNEKRSGVPRKQAEEIINVMSNYTGDNHVAGVYVTAFYNSAREIGCTPQQALQFYEAIDTDYNGSYSKKEINAAIQWAFGRGQNAKAVRSYLAEALNKKL